MPEVIIFKHFKIYIGFRNIDISNSYFFHILHQKRENLSILFWKGAIKIENLFCNKIPLYNSIIILT